MGWPQLKSTVEGGWRANASHQLGPSILSRWACSLNAWAFSKSKYSRRQKGGGGGEGAISEELGQETGTNHLCQNLLVEVVSRPKLIQRENSQWWEKSVASKLSLNNNNKTQNKTIVNYSIYHFLWYNWVINIVTNHRIVKKWGKLILVSCHKPVPARHFIHPTSQWQIMGGHS